MKKSSQLRTVTDILMIGFMLIFPQLGLLPVYIYPFLVLLILWLYLQLFDEKFSDIEFRFSQLGWKPFIVGSALGLAYAIVDYLLLGPFVINTIGFQKVAISNYYFVGYVIVNFIWMLAIAWIIGVPYEEIIFRGFIFTRIKAMIKGSWRFGISALITSILFAIYHVQQGISGVLNAFIFSLVISLLYKAFKGNLWYLICFHAMYDTFMFVMIHFGRV